MLGSAPSGRSRYYKRVNTQRWAGSSYPSGAKRLFLQNSLARTKVIQQRRLPSAYGLASKSYVKRLISANEELKHASYYVQQGLVGFSAGGFSSLNVNVISPYPGLCQINQGSGQGDRLGNRIKIKKALLKFQICEVAYDATLNNEPCPIDIRLVIFNTKSNYPFGSALMGTLLSQFFQNGDSTSTITSLPSDIMKPLNKDSMVVFHDKFYKLGPAVLSANTAHQAGYDNFANNDYRLQVSDEIDVTAAMAKFCSWNDTVTIPTSKYLYAVFLPSKYTPGISTFGANEVPMVQTLGIDIDFQDA